MGMILASLLLAAAAYPADGHTVAPIAAAKPDSELSCPAPLKNAYLSPAPGGKLGVRAPVQPGVVTCTLKQSSGKSAPVTLNFVAPKWPLAVGATRPVVLGQDTAAVLEVRGKPSRAEGSAGPATLLDDTVRAQLPASKMPQHLVVLVEGEKGGAAYAVVPLLGRATVKVQTAKDAQAEAVVAGHRTTGFSSDASGQVSVVVPAPPGFVKGGLEVRAGKKSSHAAIGLPAAKPMYALAALGPRDGVKPNATVEILAAGCDPLGLAPKPNELRAKPSAGKLTGLALLQPGLWRLLMQAPASGDVSVELHLGNATRTIAFHVGPTPAVATAEPKPEPKPEVKPKPEPKPEVAQAEPKPEPKPEAAEAKPEPKPEPKPEVVAEREPSRPQAEVEEEPAPRQHPDESPIRLELLVEGGYLTNGGALSGLAPGGQLQVAYRTGNLDVGGGIDALYASGNQTYSLDVGGTSLTTGTHTHALQLLIGPWARYRLSDRIGIDGSAGVGVSRTTQEIDANAIVSSSGTSNPLAVGVLAGLDVNFGLVRAFAGARYVTASASGDLSGNAGGFAGLLGVGVDLGI